MAINFPSTTGQATDGTFTHTVGGVIYRWNGVSWSATSSSSSGGGGGGSSYSDNAVDTHLNTASASAGEILSWNGTDYAWVTDQSGSGSGGSDPQVYNLTVDVSNSAYFAILGEDRLGGVSGNNPTITMNEGDTVKFAVNNQGTNHTFDIRVSDGGSEVSNPSPIVTSWSDGDYISWSPRVSEGGSAGTYVYDCDNHAAMGGTILVRARNTINEFDTLDTVTGRGAQTNNKITLGDAGNGGEFDISVGTGNYLKVFGGSNEVYFRNVDGNGGGGTINIQGRSGVALWQDTGNLGLNVDSNCAVQLYYQTSEKLSTVSDGITITGNINGHAVPTSATAASTFALTSDIPTDNNQLTNGAGYLTSVTASDFNNVSINDLSDVTASLPIQYQLLSYNGSTWVNTYPSIQHLTDVRSDANPQNGDILQWVSTDSRYEYVSPSTIVTSTLTGTGNPSSGELLSWNGTDYEWVVNGSYADSDVDAHLNVSGVAAGKILSWNGTDYAWVDDQSSPSTGSIFAFTTHSGNGSNYEISGTDRLTTYTNEDDPAITIKVGDTLTFDNSSLGGGHPMYIRVSAGGASVTNPAAIGEGTDNVSWTPGSAGTFYYQCGIVSHAGMIGTITVQPSDTEYDTLGTVTSRGATTTTALTVGGISIGDDTDGTKSKSIKLGDDDDLTLYYDGRAGYVTSYIESDALIIRTKTTPNEDYITCLEGGPVELFYDGSKKLATNNTGASVLGNLDVSGSISDVMGPLRQLGSNTQTGSYTLIASDAGKYVLNNSSGTTYTIPASVFSSGDMITIVNHSASDVAITQGTSMNLYLPSDGSTGNRTLSARGICTILYIAQDSAYISGMGLV